MDKIKRFKELIDTLFLVKEKLVVFLKDNFKFIINSKNYAVNMNATSHQLY